MNKAGRMVTNAKSRIALLGAGLIGREHAKLLEDHPKLELAAIADPSPTAKDLADSLGVLWGADYETVLDESTPDGVIIALPNSLHLPSGMSCIRRGLPTLIEKPIADNIVDAMKLVSAQNETGVPVLVGHHRRHSPDIRGAKRALDDGTLGQLVAVNGVWWARKHQSYFDAEWRRRQGGGPLWINLIHEIDCFRFIAGEITSVQAVSSNRQRGYEVEDTTAVVMQFACGALGTFLISDSVASPFIWDVTSGQALYFPHQREDCYYLGGTKGSLAIPTMNLWNYDNDGDWRSTPIRRQLGIDSSSCYTNQLNNFAAVIEGTEQPVVSALDGAATVAVIAAIEQAAQERRVVVIEELLASK